MPDDRRESWERRWQGTRDEDFEWSLDDVAPQLRRRLDEGGLLPGKALDLGCGAGRSTVFLADRFTSSVGIDIALPAIAQAVASARTTDGVAVFTVADAVRLPFPAASFAFVFDRGCLQNLPEPLWSRYFQEVDRLLLGGGSLQLLVSKSVPHFPSLLSSRGLRLRWSWYGKGQRTGPQFLSHAFLERIRPPSMTLDLIEDFPFVTKKGKARLFTHALFTKSDS